MTPIYLDAFATTPLDPRVAQALQPWIDGQAVGNAGSPHLFGQHAAEALSAARRNVGKLVNSQPPSVIFTSGATESNNLALTAAFAEEGGHVVSGGTEHPSLFEPLRLLAAEGRIELTLIEGTSNATEQGTPSRRSVGGTSLPMLRSGSSHLPPAMRPPSLDGSTSGTR